MEVEQTGNRITVRFNGEIPEEQQHIRRHVELLSPGNSESVRTYEDGRIESLLAADVLLGRSVYVVLMDSLMVYRAQNGQILEQHTPERTCVVKPSQSYL
jgi:hypothetical protein